MVIAVIIIAVLLILSLIGIYMSYYRTFYSPHKDASETKSPKHRYSEEAYEKTVKLSETPCERVTTTSYDGLKLSGRYFEGEKERPLCICFHGYRGSAVRDFSGIGSFLITEGNNVLLIDERAHGRSEGHTITFGVKERYDVLSWLSWANDRFGEDKPICIFGISMGGGTVLMASGLELPKNVKGIVADCPYNIPKDIILYVCKKIGLNPTLSWPVIWLAARLYGHFNIRGASAENAVRKATVPILILHGEGDDFVPMEMSRQVYEANPDTIEMHTFPDADHGLSYYYDPERYERIVRDFIKKHI